MEIEFVHTPTKLKDIVDKNEQIRIIRETHSRAHRSYKNVTKEVLEKYYWPSMIKDAKHYNKNCTACLYGRFERNPTREPLGNSLTLYKER